ncbi:MAG: hypothetical protein CO108_03150 [Deltaproteobacteria bacterium CG_4_9_14_3_um_filter_63_12]|nr:MAG: hypothetical protein CO108_03150 [Deltaproteobacteria bacterium CG_4_9_14_3_um_filter_63_12]
MVNVERKLEHLRGQYLGRVLDTIRAVVADSTPARSTLIDMSSYVVETGGKRLRALLPLLVADALGVDPEPLIPFGAACELIHNATLVHDDLQDGDEVRRGRATVWRAFGPAQAIDLGDALFYYAVLAAQRMPVSAEQREACVRRMMLDTLSVIDGQEREMVLLKEPNPTLPQYFEMVEGKTSGLFSLPIAGAAELCGVSFELTEILSSAARHLGVLFQIQDDVLDLFGEKGRDKAGCDIEEGKRSVLAVYALQHAPPEDAAELLRILDLERVLTTEAHIAHARQSFEDSGALQFALAEAVERRRRAGALCRDAGHEALAELIEGIGDVFLAPIRPLMA